MDKAKDEAINKLIAGQEKMGKEIAEIRVDITEMKVDIADLKHGQKKLESDVSDLKQGQKKLESDVSDLKQGQKKLEADVSDLKSDVSDLKQGQKELESDVSVLKSDVSDLKQGQKHTDGLILKVLDNIARLERIVVVNVENDLRTKVDTLSDADKVRQHETTDLKQICREQEERLEDHEIRISRLEKD